jgi:hypothetical protein
VDAWGIGPFDNDDAIDFAHELLESDDLTPAREALAATTDTDGWLELPEGSRALAAAAVVVAAFSGEVIRLPKELAAWLDNHADAATLADARLAMDALLRIAGPDSELREVSLAGGEGAAWIDQISRLGLHLGRMIGDETS